MDPYSRHTQSLKALQTYLGNACPQVTYNGKSYPVLPGSAIRRQDLGAGGFKLDSDLRFVTTADVWPASGPPKFGHSLTYLGDAYEVKAVHKLAGGQLLRFECNDAYQGA